MSQVDAVIGVVSGRDPSGTLFELGIAVGLNRPVLLAVDRSAGPLASEMFWLHRIDFEPGRPEPIVDAVRRMKSPAAETGKRLSIKSPARNSPVPDVGAMSHLEGTELESAIADLIRATGAEVYRSGSANADGFDLAVWDASLEPALPNPVLVEVKTRLRSDWSSSLRQVEQYLNRSGGTGVALLVYRDGPSSRELKPGYPSVIPVRLDEFADELLSAPFHVVVQRRRNRIAHGYTA